MIAEVILALGQAEGLQLPQESLAQIGSGKVLLALSGGVDSSVVAALLIKAVGCLLYTSRCV